ncbi:MAG: hypothetical protein V7K57_13025 [Nostoc sp.]
MPTLSLVRAVYVEAAFESAVDFNRVIVALRMRSLLRTPPIISYSRLSLPYFTHHTTD